MTIPLSVVRPVFKYAAEKRLNSDAILAGAGLDTSLLENPETRVTVEEMDRIYHEVIKLASDDHPGLHIGEHFTLGSANIVGHIFMSCETIGDALNMLTAYNEIITQGFRITPLISSTKISLKFNHTVQHADPMMTIEHIECIFSACITILGKLTNEEIRPIEVKFSHSPPPVTDEYERIFKAPVIFNASINALVYDKKLLTFPIPQPNTELLHIFEEHAARILNEIKKDKPFSRKVSSLLLRNKWQQLPTIEKIAGELSMSVRNLQKKLAKEETSYRVVFNNVYHKKALTILEDDELTVAEVSYLLGFSEPSAFHRSFKRWAGQTPQEYRISKIKKSC